MCHTFSKWPVSLRSCIAAENSTKTVRYREADLCRVFVKWISVKGFAESGGNSTKVTLSANDIETDVTG